MKPIIGITPSPTNDVMPHGVFRRYAVGDAYVAAVLAAGGIPVILPPQTRHVAELIGSVDGILFSGGADIDPARYGVAEIHPATYGVDEARDAFEIDLARAAVARDVPLFGICRGIQLLNVAFGGSLIQDVPSCHLAGDRIAHRQHESVAVPAHDPSHPVSVALDGMLGLAAGSHELGVNSFHHQAIDRLAPALQAIAEAPDGIIEAVVRPGDCWVLGVQWHPELMFDHHPEQLWPFRALVEEAAARRGDLAAR